MKYGKISYIRKIKGYIKLDNNDTDDFKLTKIDLIHLIQHAATRDDINQLRNEMKTDINQLRSEMKTEINQLRNEVNKHINQLRNEMSSNNKRLRSEIR